MGVPLFSLIGMTNRGVGVGKSAQYQNFPRKALLLITKRYLPQNLVGLVHDSSLI